MLRKNVMMTPQHERWLKAEAKDKGVSVSEVLRKAIDQYFTKPKEARK